MSAFDDNIGCPRGSPSISSRAPSRDLQPTMRLIARFVVLMVAVFGVSLAFAWAWDRSDKPHDASPVHAS